MDSKFLERLSVGWLDGKVSSPKVVLEMWVKSLYSINGFVETVSDMYEQGVEGLPNYTPQISLECKQLVSILESYLLAPESLYSDELSITPVIQGIPIQVMYKLTKVGVTPTYELAKVVPDEKLGKDWSKKDCKDLTNSFISLVEKSIINCPKYLNVYELEENGVDLLLSKNDSYPKALRVHGTLTVNAIEVLRKGLTLTAKTIVTSWLSNMSAGLSQTLPKPVFIAESLDANSGLLSSENKITRDSIFTNYPIIGFKQSSQLVALKDCGFETTIKPSFFNGCKQPAFSISNPVDRNPFNINLLIQSLSVTNRWYNKARKGDYNIADTLISPWENRDSKYFIYSPKGENILNYLAYFPYPIIGLEITPNFAISQQAIQKSMGVKSLFINSGSKEYDLFRPEIAKLIPSKSLKDYQTVIKLLRYDKVSGNPFTKKTISNLLDAGFKVDYNYHKAQYKTFLHYVALFPLETAHQETLSRHLPVNVLD